MLLNIYLISTGACLAVDTISMLAILNKMKREGYEIVNSKKSFSEVIRDCLKIAGYVAVPVINVILSATMLFLSDEKTDELFKEMYRKGIITKKTDALSYDEKIDAIRKKKAELEELKESLGQCQSANVTFEDDDEDIFKPGKHGYSL
ncbi:MAG: hypothetical protein II625_08310 [Bacilli bacterium]|nr:hypothetical protein [Bacilli bacterium]